MLRKIEDYDQKPFAVAPQTNAVQSQATRTMLEAHKYLTEPQKDPLYFENVKKEEHKNLGSQYTSQHNLMM